MNTLQLQIKLNKDCEMEIIDGANNYSREIISILNDVINARENFDNDYFADLIVYRNRKFFGGISYVEITSKDYLTVVDSVNAFIKQNADDMDALLEHDMFFINNMIRAELALAM